MMAVERGVELLDQIEPGWDRKIDLDKLDLASPCNCVLGQLENKKTPRVLRYTRKLNRIGGDVLSHPGQYGFNSFGHTSFGNLTSAWRKVIKSRRVAT